MEENSVNGNATEDTHMIRDLKEKKSEDRVEQAFTKEYLHPKNGTMHDDTKEGNSPKPHLFHNGGISEDLQIQQREREEAYR